MSSDGDGPQSHDSGEKCSVPGCISTVGPAGCADVLAMGYKKAGIRDHPELPFPEIS